MGGARSGTCIVGGGLASNAVLRSLLVNRSLVIVTVHSRL